MQTEKTRQERLRRWLNHREEERKQRLAKRFGTPVNKAVGGSLMPADGSVAPDNSPDGEEQDGSQEDKEGLKEPLKNGDEIEKFQLYDCETGEPVTLDGMGGNDAEPRYPIGFENCEREQLTGTIYYAQVFTIVSQEYIYFMQQSFKQRQSSVDAVKASLAAGGTPYNYQDYQAEITKLNNYANGTTQTVNGVVTYLNSALPRWYDITQTTCELRPDLCPTATWPTDDKNHLVYDSANGCFSTLCGSLNPYVLEKYQGCNDEMILCDEDGNKNKVKLNADGSIDVTQSNFNQTATLKNGKVVAVRKLTEAQKEREFNAS